MTWAKVTDKQTGEVHFDSTPDRLSSDQYTIELLDGEPIEPARALKKSRVEGIRLEKETDTCVTPVGTVKIDRDSKVNINGALSLCKLLEETSTAFSLKFTLADGSRVTLDNTTVRQLAGAVGQYVASVYDHAASLLDALDAAATLDDLNAIDITAGWP